MKYIAFLFIILIFAACKKKTVNCGQSCPCIQGIADSTIGGNIDSATFYQQLIGTWYLREVDTPFRDIGCPHHCYCDAPYPVIFLSNNTFVMHFAGNITDTFPYNFFTLAPQKISTQSYFYTYTNNAIKGQIQYVNNDFMIIQIASISPPEDFDACPVFFLTKN